MRVLANDYEEPLDGSKDAIAAMARWMNSGVSGN